MKKIQRIIYYCRMALAILLLGALISPHIALSQETLNVKISVNNPLNVDRINEPVTGGIPIPESYGIVSCDKLNILDTSGQPVPSQFTVTARWGGKPEDESRPIKWILVTFPADVPALGGTVYALQSGTKNETQTGLSIISRSNQRIEIDTGSATFVIGGEPFRFFNAVTINGREIIQSSESGICLTDEQGRVFTSFYGPAPTLTVNEEGPVRIVLKVNGQLSNATGEPFLDYQTMIYLYAESSCARVLLTLGNHREALIKTKGTGYDVFDYYGQNSVTFEEAFIGLQLASPNSILSFTYPSLSTTKSGTLSAISIYQDSSGTDYWNRYTSEDHPRTNSHSRFRGYQVKANDQLFETGDQFAGWLDIADDAKGISAGIFHFWQNFPKGITASKDGEVRLNLFPLDYDGNYNFRVGEEKTTELFFHFHTDVTTISQASNTAQALSKPMTALSPTEWYIQSGALPAFAAEIGQIEDRFGQFNSSEDRVKYAYYNDRTLMADPTYTGPDSDYFPYDALWISTSGHPASIDYFNFYGWAWWGNQPLDFEAYGNGKAGPFNVKYDFDYGAWLQFLRTRDVRWQEMAEAFTRHLELLMLSDITTRYDTERWRNAVFGMSAHNETGNENGNRNRLGPVMDTCFGARGALLHYYLTGYPRSEEFIDRVGGYAYDFHSKTRRWEASPYLADSFYTDGSRPMTNLITVLTEAFRYSGDRKYQALAQEVMDYFAPEKQPWINGPVNGNEEYIATIFLMGYVNAMARYARLMEEYEDLKDQSVLAKQRVSCFVDWLLTYGSFTYNGWLTAWYHYKLNGENAINSDMINNWLLELADACAYAYAFTGEQRYLDAAGEFFHTGVNNPFYMGSALTYSDAKEAVNHAVFGHIYLYYKNFQVEPPPEDLDETPPQVDILSPSDGSQVSDAFTFEVSARDDQGIQRVSFHVDDQLLETLITPPWRITLQSLSLSKGEHTLYASAEDPSGNTSVSDTIVIYRPPLSVTLVLRQGESWMDGGIPYDGLKDATLRRTSETGDGNYGSSGTLINYNGLYRDYSSLLRFSLEKFDIPEGVIVTSAILCLTPKIQQTTDVHLSPLQDDWMEGTGTYSNTHDGASWHTRDGVEKWHTAGGDFDETTDYGFGPNGIAAKAVQTGGVDQFDVTALVNQWLQDKNQNHGVILFVPDAHKYTQVTYFSKEASDKTKRPALILHYEN